ncbi:MAG TPA: hypothetical protein VMX14_06475 [Anaerolineae bacterium]|nr:hypothetical protein [Anaerolineae bacterium]
MPTRTDLNKTDVRFAFAAERQQQGFAGHGVSSLGEGGVYAFGYYPCHIAGGIALHAREQLPKR